MVARLNKSQGMRAAKLKPLIADEAAECVALMWTKLGVREKRGHKYFELCRCACGTERFVWEYNLGRGSNSCGCIRRNSLSRVKHKHGASSPSSPLYATYMSWTAARNRCFNPKNRDWIYYGGKGIKVCERWANSFENFLEDMGERPKEHTIDRIDSNRDYEPSNCRWATIFEQNQRNQPVQAAGAYGR